MYLRSALRNVPTLSRHINLKDGGLQLSTTAQSMSRRNKPKNSGDSGPEKNYVKKMMKKSNKEVDTEGTARTAFMNALKAIESGEHLPQDKQAQEDELELLLKPDENHDGDSSLGVPFRRWRPHFDSRPRGARRDRATKDSMSEADLMPIGFANPNSGPRLGIFNPSCSQKVMPSGNPNLTERERQKQLEQIQLLQTTSYFEDRLKVPYPRQFPVDNEDYEHAESNVSFKDHVLLDHLIKEFPSKGPVRHFMELVVTGLSMNPDYSVTEKREIVEWYKDYFAQFTPTELQALSTDSLPPVDAAVEGRSNLQ